MSGQKSLPQIPPGLGAITHPNVPVRETSCGERRGRIADKTERPRRMGHVKSTGKGRKDPPSETRLGVRNLHTTGKKNLNYHRDKTHFPNDSTQRGVQNKQKGCDFEFSCISTFTLPPTPPPRLNLNNTPQKTASQFKIK